MSEHSINIWHISDTHGYHDLLTIPEGIDVVIHSGDASNSKSPYANERELRRFIDWFGALPIETKIFSPGNHETSIPGELVTRNAFIAKGILYLENEYTYIESLKVFASPYTPTFGHGWAFNKARNSMHDVWSQVDEDVDIIITHGPPKHILDSTYGKYESENKIVNHGDRALRRHILERIKPKLSLFGHMHNNEDIVNAGVVKLRAHDTIFSNGSVVTDNKFGVLTSNGNILTILI